LAFDRRRNARISPNDLWEFVGPQLLNRFLVDSRISVVKNPEVLWEDEKSDWAAHAPKILTNLARETVELGLVSLGLNRNQHSWRFRTSDDDVGNKGHATRISPARLRGPHKVLSVHLPRSSEYWDMLFDPIDCGIKT